MIVFDDVKAALLLNPKTGTRSAISYFGSLPFHGRVRVVHGGHAPYREVARAINGDHQLYAFYRCPVERFVSACNYIVSQWQCIWDGYPISQDTIAKAQAEIRDLTPEDILGVVARSDHGPVLELAAPQTEWFGPGVRLLDFRKFNEELIGLVVSFGLDAPADVPRVNESPAKFRADDLPPELVGRIKQYYAPDYEFFAARGVTFER